MRKLVVSAVCAGGNTEVSSDQAYFSHNHVTILPKRGSAFSKRMHHLETLDGGIGCFERFEPARRLDQHLEFSVIGLNGAVQIFNLTMQSFRG